MRFNDLIRFDFCGHVIQSALITSKFHKGVFFYLLVELCAFVSLKTSLFELKIIPNIEDCN
jgi:hypothetical protein